MKTKQLLFLGCLILSICSLASCDSAHPFKTIFYERPTGRQAEARDRGELYHCGYLDLYRPSGSGWSKVVTMQLCAEQKPYRTAYYAVEEGGGGYIFTHMLVNPSSGRKYELLGTYRGEKLYCWGYLP